MNERWMTSKTLAPLTRQGRRHLLRLGVGMAVAGLSGLIAAPAFAQAADSPVGLWQSIDDETGKPKALIRVVDNGGVLSGRIEKLLGDKPDAVCEACEGELKDKPVTGMTIISGLKKGDEWYEGGTILDPAKGKVYRCKLKTIDGGNKLEVRGFIGVALLGRTQTWVRQRP